MSFIVVISVILTVTTIFSIAYSNDECLQVKTVPIDENWLKNSSALGFYVPVHSKCQNCKDKNDEFSFIKGRTVEQKICWNMDTLTKWGPHVLPFHCSYHQIENQNCHLDASSISLNISLKGNLQITKTDNSTYFAGAMCIIGKENFWLIASITETLPETLQTEIFDHFALAGFKIGGESIAIEGETPVFIRKLIGVECPVELNQEE